VIAAATPSRKRPLRLCSNKGDDFRKTDIRRVDASRVTGASTVGWFGQGQSPITRALFHLSFPRALSNLGHAVGRGTIAEILARHGIEPAPQRERKTTWKEFLTQNWDLIVAADFFTIEAWTRRGLQRFVILFFMELSTRKVEIAGITSSPSGLWMNQIGRNLTDAVDGLLNGKRYLIHDRDPLFTAEFLSMLAEAGVASVKLPPRSPNLNAYAERFVRTTKESCLERTILFGESAVRKATAEFMAHYHSERNHQCTDLSRA
jgi:putative transposase